MNFYSFSDHHIQWLCQALTPDSIPLKHSQCPLPCLIGPCVQPWDFLSMLLVSRGALLQRPDRHQLHVALCCADPGHLNLLSVSSFVHLMGLTYQALREACTLAKPHTACMERLTQLQKPKPWGLGSPTWVSAPSPQQDGDEGKEMGKGMKSCTRRQYARYKRSSTHTEMPKPYIWHRDSAKLMVTKKDGNPKV